MCPLSSTVYLALEATKSIEILMQSSITKKVYQRMIVIEPKQCYDACNDHCYRVQNNCMLLVNACDERKQWYVVS